MENTRTPDRSAQGANEVIMHDVPRSGMDLSYTSHDGGIPLGRLIPNTFQRLMPSDKYRFANRANITFEQITTPLFGNVDVSQHNFFVPYRAVDKTFENLMTPTKLNSMGVNNSAASFSFNVILRQVAWIMDQFVTFSQNTWPAFKVTFNLPALRVALQNTWSYVYLNDALQDLLNQLSSHLGMSLQSGTVVKSFNLNTYKSDANWPLVLLAFYDVFDFFVGKRSLLDKFGYYYVSHKQLEATLSGCLDHQLSLGHFQFTDNNNWTAHEILSDVAGFYQYTYPLQNEYALRAYYAIWFEYYRHFDIEPRSSNLPEWRSFGGTSIFGTIPTNISDLHYLVPRIRCWSKDQFVSAGVDDISRHVFAPIMSNNSSISYQTTDTIQPPTTGGNAVVGQLTSIDTKWRNPNTGTVSSLTVTLPSGILSQLRSTSVDTPDYGISLVNLRKAAMMENWLKRIYYGGDEYRDRMLSLYNARIEDYRINRPQWLSSSLDSRDVKQEVSNSGAPAGSTSPTVATIGTRTATATATQNGSDVHSNFTPEFGIYIGILSVMPKATYDTLCYQNLELKYSDFPVPQFANSMEDTIIASEISRQSLNTTPFGYCAYGHAYRGRVDEVHGDYLDEKFDYVFSRSYDGSGIYTTPKLSYGWVHCRPYLPMFVNQVLLDGQVYGDFMHDFFVEHCLPTPVETI